MTTEGRETGRGQVLPFYVLADESYSMDGPGGIDAINQLFPALQQSLREEPAAAEKVRFGVVTFAHNAEVVLALSDLTALTEMPGLAPRGNGTNYEAAFSSLQAEIIKDVRILQSDGYQVLRPAVFFMSDGQPNQGDWKLGLHNLTSPSFPLRPNIISFGFGDADEEIIRAIGTLAAFKSTSEQSPAQAIAEFATALTRSIMASGAALASGSHRLQVIKPSNLIEMEVDPLPEY